MKGRGLAPIDLRVVALSRTYPDYPMLIHLLTFYRSSKIYLPAQYPEHFTATKKFSGPIYDANDVETLSKVNVFHFADAFRIFFDMLWVRISRFLT